MIKINLAQKKRAAPLVNAGAASGGLGGLWSKLQAGLGGGASVSATPAMKVTIITAVICIVLGFVAMSFWDNHQKQEIAVVQQQISELEAQIRRMDSELAKTAGFQTLKKKLEEDGLAMKLKIDTIEKLMSERRDPPQILKTLSEVTPKEIWLTDFQMKSADVRISGGSRGLSPVSDFMKTLEETIYFKEIALKRSTSKREQGIDTASFELEAKRK